MVKRCDCGELVAKRTSWTYENLGKKFIACKFFNHETGERGCNTFQWVDEEPSEWKRDVINVFVAEKHRLATDNNIW
ncbi:DNA topoisomerase 3-alpha [Bienertia sinuspersici]